MDWNAKLRRVGKRYKNVKREREETIVGAAEAGLSRREIAAEVGVHHTRVQQIIQKSADSAESSNATG